MVEVVFQLVFVLHTACLLGINLLASLKYAYCTSILDVCLLYINLCSEGLGVLCLVILIMQLLFLRQETKLYVIMLLLCLICTLHVFSSVMLVLLYIFNTRCLSLVLCICSFVTCGNNFLNRSTSIRLAITPHVYFVIWHLTLPANGF